MDRKSCRLSVIIPTINEEDGIASTLSELPLRILERIGFECEVIVVDGGSNDRTRERAEQLGAKVILEPRRGYGRAYKTGFDAAQGDILITSDGDSTYPVSLVPTLVQNMVNNGIEFITTNRLDTLEPGAMSFLRRFGNYLLSLWVRLLFSVKLTDSQSGMWVIRRNVLEKVIPSSDGMMFSEEIKIKAFRFCKSIEIPIPYKRRIGKSKMMAILHGIGNLLYLLRLRLSMD